MTIRPSDPASFSPFTRRSFLKGASAAALLPGSVWARGGRASASNRITLGVIGWGMMGPVSYTHLDVYKRQARNFVPYSLWSSWRHWKSFATSRASITLSLIHI